jgi:hypothetical protein
MKSILKILVALLLLTSLLAACSGAGELTVTAAWARPAAAGSNGAIYFEIHNASGQDDVLLRVESEAAGVIELHQAVMIDPAELTGDDNGHAGMDMSAGDMVMQMALQDSVAIPQGERVLFAPGSLHAMLVNLNNALVAGDSFEATLVFEKAGPITVVVSVEQR